MYKKKTIKEVLCEYNDYKKSHSLSINDREDPLYLKIDFSNVWKSLKDMPEDILNLWYVDFKEIVDPLFFNDNFVDITTALKYITEDLDDEERSWSALDIVEWFNKNAPNISQYISLRRPRANKVWLVTVVPNVGRNINTIINKMEDFNWFVLRTEVMNINGSMLWTLMTFEPKFPYDNYNYPLIYRADYLYHISPILNHQSIMKNGIVPSSKNKHYDYPPRVYCFKKETNSAFMEEMLKALSKKNNTYTDYVMYLIDAKKLDTDWWVDCECEYGVFSYDTIPLEAIINSNVINNRYIPEEKNINKMVKAVFEYMDTHISK